MLNAEYLEKKHMLFSEEECIYTHMHMYVFVYIFVYVCMYVVYILCTK